MLLCMRSWQVFASLGLASLSLGLGCGGSDDDAGTTAPGGAGGNATTSQAGSNQASGGSNQASGGSNQASGGSSADGGRVGNGGRRGGAGGNSAAGGNGSNSAGSNAAGTAGTSAATAGTSSTGGSAGSGGSATNPADPYGDARTRCVNRTNELRATKGLGPIPILPKAEPCADGQAKADSISGMAHSAFDACLNEVKWKGAGQNECPNYGSVEDTLTKCLDAMWAEGPGGGHYDNMVGNSTHTACGIYTTPGGKVWLVEDFWTE
jgi:Cysteine-rich secretory protein family